VGAFNAGRDIAALKVLAHVGPEIRIADSFVSFVETKMA
jgi:hypothetical protein